MTVAAEDFTKPGGRLNPKILWPGMSEPDYTAKLDGFIEDAVAQVALRTDLTTTAAQDSATWWWVEGRAWDEIADELTRFPSTREYRDEGSGSYLLTQITKAKEKADYAYAQFAAVADPVDEEEDTAVPVPRSSVSAPISFRF